MGFIRSKLLLCIVLLCGSLSLNAAVKKKNGPSLASLKKQIANQKRSVEKLQDRIHKLETNLDSGNKRYMKVLSERKKIEILVEDTSSKLIKVEEELLLEEERLTKSLAALALSELGDGTDAADLATKKIIIKSMNKLLRSYKLASKENKKLKTVLVDLKGKFKEFLDLERELAGLLEDLEIEKKGHAENYLSQLEVKKNLQNDYERLQLKVNRKKRKKLQRKLNVSQFDLPITDYIDWDHGKKGVTFKFKGNAPVTAAAAGEIDYIGNLTTYGKIVMIDHGNETRSLVLGNFSPKVKKGSKVKRGQILGYTRGGSNKSGQIYFEVRKKNIAQNTILLLDEKVLSKKIAKSSI